MRDNAFYVSSLLELADASVADRRALWRQAMAALSRTAAEDGPGPLEGLHRDVLVRAVNAAIAGGLADDLDWLSPQAAGVALYTLAAALPVGFEQRELGRRVLARMLAGNAETFTAIATTMALSSGKALNSLANRARIALVTELPLAHGIADGPLALALVSRRDYQREWVTTPSTRSLPARRLVAKLLERAAREAARRAQMGDLHAFRVFQSEAVKAAYDRLLADRESLVWRYVAVARGLAAGWIPELKQEITEGLREGLSPTEWRRAAASLAAFGAVRPDDAVKITSALVKRGLFTWEDPPSAAAFVWGIPRTLEAEPEVATKLLDLLLPASSPEVAEAVAELPYEYGMAKGVERVLGQARELLRAIRDKPKGEDDGADALYQEIARDLEPGARADEPVRFLATAALDTFVTEGAPAAYQRGRGVLRAATGGMDALEGFAKDDDASGGSGSLARRTSMVVMRDLDATLLERPIVSDLLKLGAAAEVRGSEEALDVLRGRLAEWILMCETPDELGTSIGEPKHPTLRLRRLRALLHLVDGDLGEGLEPTARLAREDGDERTRRLQTLWQRTVKALLEHFRRDPAAVLNRTLLAALARAFDALVRLGVCDVIDALLGLSLKIRSRRDFDTLAEASMDPDLRHVLARYARFLRESEPTLEVSAGESLAPNSRGKKKGPEERLKSIDDLANDLTPESSSRSEALRNVLVRLHHALAATVKVTALSGLSTSGTADVDVIVAVETLLGSLSQMCIGATSRLEPDMTVSVSLSAGTPNPLSLAISPVLAEAGELDDDVLGHAIEELTSGLPHGISRLVGGLLWRLSEVPTARPSANAGGLLLTEHLPAWLPARRTLGGFYVHRALGQGTTATVFVVSRAEEKNEPEAERFALKVPEYTAMTARTLSEGEFRAMFRDEASALLGLPSHPNLARFVTFDAGTKPYPILVMELVEGPSLERLLHAKTLEFEQCLRVLDHILAGLEAMHSVGIGHLDLKPGNVVLRNNKEAVLVDFGLAGRKIRQGCGTGSYGAPEVWGVLPPNYVPSPMPADIYSFGCLAFELLTGETLFAGSNDAAQITLHLLHDGWPDVVKALAMHPQVFAIAKALQPALMRTPEDRPTATKLRERLRAATAHLNEVKWPVTVR